MLLAKWSGKSAIENQQHVFLPTQAIQRKDLTFEIG
jgi:hypothetical protein